MSKVSFSNLIKSAESKLESVESDIKIIDSALVELSKNKDLFKKYGFEVSVNGSVIF